MIWPPLQAKAQAAAHFVQQLRLGKIATELLSALLHRPCKNSDSQPTRT